MVHYFPANCLLWLLITLRIVYNKALFQTQFKELKETMKARSVQWKENERIIRFLRQNMFLFHLKVFKGHLLTEALQKIEGDH